MVDSAIIEPHGDRDVFVIRKADSLSGLWRHKRHCEVVVIDRGPRDGQGGLMRPAFKTASRLPLHITVSLSVGQLGRVFVRADFLYALVAEVRADDDVSRNRVSVTPYASNKIEIEP